MANNFDSNITRVLLKKFLPMFDSMRVLSKNVNTQFLSGAFNASSGDKVDIKRPTDYISVRTPKGDLTAETPSDIITGKATGTVQEYFTAFVDFDEADEAIKMDQLEKLLRPLATRIVTDLELDFARFMMENTGLLSGTVGNPIATWDDIAGMGAIMKSSGIPNDNSWIASVNSFTERKLASDTRSLGAGGSAGDIISEAHRKAILTDNFAGLKVMTATTLASYTTGTGADRAGTIAVANPDATYLTAKDSMTQSIQVEAFEANLVVAAGETLTITGRNRLNLSTRRSIFDDVGAAILFSGTVVSTVTLSGTGTGTLVITGPALFEAAGQYNTVDSAPIVGDVITLGGAPDTAIQPNLFWHKDAFAIGSVPIKKLQSIDTLGTTEDGLQFRVSKGSDFIKNQQKIRFDFRPAYGVLNPFFGGQGYGA